MHDSSILDKRYLRMAAIWAENSYCRRRQVGALIVKDKMIISDRYNGTPSGFENICEADGVTKPYVLHADEPCIECAKLIIQAGIRRVVYARGYRLHDGLELLQRAGIRVDFMPGIVPETNLPAATDFANDSPKPSEC